VKNWTLRQRILASFAVIIAIMLLMVVVSFSRLMKIDASADRVRTDAVPGVYFSSMIRGAWVDSFNLTQQLVGLSGRREMTAADQAMYKSFEERLSEQMANYRKTIFTVEDQVLFDEFEARHQLFNQEMTNVLDLYQRKEYEQARLALEQKLAPAWINGRKQLNSLLEDNHALAEKPRWPSAKR